MCGRILGKAEKEYPISKRSCCLQTLAVQFTGGGGGEIGAFCKVLVPPEAGSFPFRMAGHMHSPRNKPRTRIEDESGIIDYNLGEILGKGAFGVVWEATHVSSKKKFAIKMVHKDKPGSVSIQLLEREIQVLNHVDHHHIIQLVEVFETPKKVFMVLEMCRGGELSDLLKEKKSFQENEVKVIMKQLAEAVVYMHDKDMVHRDLKLENILLSDACKDSEPFNIKVTDFGLSHMKGLPGCDDLMSSRCGTLYYMAPEVLKNKHEYSKLCDVWSMGVIMYALLCGRMPFNAETAPQLEEQILTGTLKFREPEWISISDGVNTYHIQPFHLLTLSQLAKELIRGMLNVSTINRITARQVLEDPWITGGASRKRIDPLMMLSDDSPPPPLHSFKKEQSSPTADIKTLSVKEERVKVSKSPTKSASLPRSTSANKVLSAPRKGGGASSSPVTKKTVSSSVSTGRLQSSTRVNTGRGGAGGGANSRKPSARY